MSTHFQGLALRAAAALVALSFAGQAAAFADDDARRAILELRETVKNLQKDLDLSRNAQMQLMSEITKLQNRSSQLTGRVEELTNALEVEKRSTRELYGALDKRLAAFEPQMVVINGEAVQVEPKEKAAYDAAVLLLQDSKYKEAAKAFERFADKWPQSPYRPDAIFWWGSAAFAAEQYKTVISSQNQLIREYPKSVRAADAMLLVGSAQAAAGNVNAARATMQKVVKNYPGTDAAKSAEERLKTFGKKK